MSDREAKKNVSAEEVDGSLTPLQAQVRNLMAKNSLTQYNGTA